MFCRNCGTQLPEGATHCVQCGYAVEQENVKETKSVSGVDVKEKIQKNRKGLLVAGAVVVVALLVIVLFVTKKTTINLNDYHDLVVELVREVLVKRNWRWTDVLSMTVLLSFAENLLKW